MGLALFEEPIYRLGLFTLGCCPGGTGSNFWTLMFNGDINLSITMTAVSTIAAMGGWGGGICRENIKAIN